MYAEYYQDSDPEAFTTHNEEKLWIFQGIAEKAKSETESMPDIYLNELHLHPPLWTDIE